MAYVQEKFGSTFAAKSGVSKLGAWMRGERGEMRLPWRMFWVGFVLRVSYMTLAHTYRMRLILDHFEFGWEMGRIARALVTGHGYADPFNGHSGPTSWTAPLYPLMIAGVFKIFGIYTLKSSWMILTINSLFSALVAPAVYEMGWRCFGRGVQGMKIALWSGWIWALYPAAMQYAVKWIWETSVTVCFFAWVLVIALRVRGVGAEPGEETQTTRRWIAFGALWGIIALLNSSLLLVLPPAGLWMLGGLRGEKLSSAMRKAVLSAIVCAAFLAPWIVRNAMVFHKFVPMRANLGSEMYESINVLNQGFPWGGTLSMAAGDPKFQRYAQLSEVEFSRQQGELARTLIKAHPGRFLHYTLLRFYFFWDSVPHPFERSVANEIGREVQFNLLSVTGLLGLILALRRRIPGAWLFFWAFLLAPSIYYLVTVQARFRHPLEPLICVLSVYLFQSADRTRVWSWSAPASAPASWQPNPKAEL